jgi:ABC-type transporter Mla MlaB component
LESGVHWKSIVFRLEKKLSQEGTCLTLDGDISTECIDVIETSCDEAMADGKPVDLFLREVMTVDEAGRALLCRLAAKGVRLLANGVYASYLIEAANRTASCRQ